MTRYFYRDPTVMPYMAKQFGMRFVDALSGEEFHDWGDFLHWNWNQKNGPWESDDYLYIHPGSLPLLEPKENDQVFCPNLFKTYRVIGEAPRYAHEINAGFAKECNVRIILRDGKPFHWPECEAA